MNLFTLRERHLTEKVVRSEKVPKLFLQKAPAFIYLTRTSPVSYFRKMLHLRCLTWIPSVNYCRKKLHLRFLTRI